MLTKGDLSAMGQLIRTEVRSELRKEIGPAVRLELKSALRPVKSDIGVLERGIIVLRKGQERLQDSINTLSDDLGEDVYILKEKMKRVEHHLGWANS